MVDDTREDWLARTFVELADTLVADFDVVDFLSMLVERSATLLGGSEVGLAVANPHGQLRVLASSTERMRVLELVEVQNEEGPCRDCFRTGEQILNQRVDLAEARWPRFAPMARDAGFNVLHALPMRLRGQVIGAINVFDPTRREMTPHQANMIQAFADVATIGILQERSARDHAVLTNQLATALSTRVIIEQAKGKLAEALTVSMDEAFNLLRDHARRNNLRLTVVAGTVIDGTLPTTALMASYRGPSR
jgi:hypothetical protein